MIEHRLFFSLPTTDQKKKIDLRKLAHVRIALGGGMVHGNYIDVRKGATRWVFGCELGPRGLVCEVLCMDHHQRMLFVLFSFQKCTQRCRMMTKYENAPLYDNWLANIAGNLCFEQKLTAYRVVCANYGTNMSFVLFTMWNIHRFSTHPRHLREKIFVYIRLEGPHWAPHLPHPLTRHLHEKRSPIVPAKALVGSICCGPRRTGAGSRPRAAPRTAAGNWPGKGGNNGPYNTTSTKTHGLI